MAAIKILCKAYLKEPAIIEYLKQGGYIEKINSEKCLVYIHNSDDDIVGRVSTNCMLDLLFTNKIEQDTAALTYHKYYVLKNLETFL